MPEPQTPTEYVSAISRSAGKLAGGCRELGLQAVGVGRRLQEDVHALDREVARLAREVDPAEIARLEARLARGAVVEPGEGEDERQMRKLLQDQRDVLLRLRLRVEEAQARRDQRLQALRELWQGLAELEGASTVEEGELVSRLRERLAGLHERPEPGFDATETRAR